MFSPLETKVLAHIAANVAIYHPELTVESIHILQEQIKRATLKSREWTGMGFFSDFGVPDNVSPFVPAKFVISPLSIGAYIEDDPGEEVGFLLFIDEGKISCLEGFTYGDTKWTEQTKTSLKF